MLIQSIQLRGFRNLQDTLVSPHPGFNVFSGNNGQGKTNLLEAIYAVCTLRSFRTSRLRDLIQLRQESAHIQAQVHKADLLRKYELTIKPRSKIVRLDEKAVRPISQYFGKFNVVLFAPEDLQIIKSSPNERRKFLDRAVFTNNPQFLPQAQNYEKVLKNRNLTLKDDRLQNREKQELLEVYDTQLAGFSAQIIHARLSYLTNIIKSFQEVFESITRATLPISMSYQSKVLVQHQWTAGDTEFPSLENLEEQALLLLSRSRKEDLARGVTSTGPHRDILEFSLMGQLAPIFASQGQLRAMILAWKIAEMQILTCQHEDPPVLLLDDVSSELDPEKNKYLFDFLNNRPGQCFITTTDPRYILLKGERQDFHVHNGIIDKIP